jgi:predicted  nucleic acid-binding Zn-ribbon protein
LEQDFIVELENKIDSLISAYTNLKNEKEHIALEIKNSNNRIQELEGENEKLSTELQSLKDISADQQKKLDTAANKVRELITKLEVVE